MSSGPAKTLRATLVSGGNNLGWTIARIPLDLKKAWPGWAGRRVLGAINGFAFRTSLFPSPQGYTLLVNNKMQAGAKARRGDTVTLRLQPDRSPQPDIPVPAELAAELKSDRKLRRWFDALPPSHIKGISAWVAQPKSAEIRLKRAAQMAERLLLTMEGELEPPPILRAAFARQPLAEQGWRAMTPTQRRGHLFGIFYYQTTASRERRLAQAMEEALRVARKQRLEN